MIVAQDTERAWNELPPGGNLLPEWIVESLMRLINERLDRIEAGAGSREQSEYMKQADDELTAWYKAKAHYQKVILIKEGKWKNA